MAYQLFGFLFLIKYLTYMWLLGDAWLGINFKRVRLSERFQKPSLLNASQPERPCTKLSNSPGVFNHSNSASYFATVSCKNRERPPEGDWGQRAMLKDCVITWVIIGNPMMKKEMQHPRVNSALCVRKYLGNSSETEVTIVSIVANWKTK